MWGSWARPKKGPIKVSNSKKGGKDRVKGRKHHKKDTGVLRLSRKERKIQNSNENNPTPNPEKKNGQKTETDGQLSDRSWGERSKDSGAVGPENGFKGEREKRNRGKKMEKTIINSETQCQEKNQKFGAGKVRQEEDLRGKNWKRVGRMGDPFIPGKTPGKGKRKKGKTEISKKCRKKETKKKKKKHPHSQRKGARRKGR